MKLPCALSIALLAAATCAQAQDFDKFPKLKAGLWEMTNTSDRVSAKEKGAQVSTLCLDDSVQNQMMEFSQGMMRGMCSKHELKLSGSTVTGDSVCQLGSSTMTSKSVMKFSGNTSYRTEAKATYDPPLMGMTQSTTIIEAKHIGACPAGMQPGDIKMPSGAIINIKQLSGQAPRKAP